MIDFSAAAILKPLYIHIIKVRYYFDKVQRVRSLKGWCEKASLGTEPGNDIITSKRLPGAIVRRRSPNSHDYCVPINKAR